MVNWGECLQVQQHSFNCPYQAGSPKLLPHCDTADDAMVYELGLQENDLVLMATDGVFDNLWDAELEALLATYLDVCPPFLPPRDPRSVILTHPRPHLMKNGCYRRGGKPGMRRVMMRSRSRRL